MSFRDRISAVKTTRWVRFAVVSVIFFLWVAWLGNPWVLLAWLLLFDIYITGYIPLTWWKKSKSATVRSVMSWVDALLYTLVLVYFVFTFVGQNYQIPSSSLEKSLLVGDYLWVNKMAYGPRVPNTPIHFPLVQNTLPVLGTKSYLDWPEWKYHRLKGLGNVERGDIVVFNFPAGDTVALKRTNPDYYTLVSMYGRDVVNGNKEEFGDVIYRPVDRRENYVKRAIGLPGETIEMRSGIVYIDGEPLEEPKNAQHNYYYQPLSPFGEADFERYGIARDDRIVPTITADDVPTLRALGFTVNDDGSVPPIYLSPLTKEAVAALGADSRIPMVLKMEAPQEPWLYPLGHNNGRTREDYPALWIPKKGESIVIDSEEKWLAYHRVIRNYEHHPDAEFRDGRLYIGGKPQDSYTFEMDYYFMLGDNRDMSLDSRYWGFVPEDHIVGKPMMVLASFDKDKSLFNGGIRWNRVLRKANPDK